jgi:hypothetical protein
MNILEQISELSTRPATDKKMRTIKTLAAANANMLDQILFDYVRQNQDEPTYRKARLKAAKRMLGERILDTAADRRDRRERIRSG